MLPELAPAKGACGPTFRVWFAGSRVTHDVPSKMPWCPPLEAGVVLAMPAEVQALLAAESEVTRLHVATAASHWELPVQELPRVTHHQEVVRQSAAPGPGGGWKRNETANRRRTTGSRRAHSRGSRGLRNLPQTGFPSERWQSGGSQSGLPGSVVHT